MKVYKLTVTFIPYAERTTAHVSLREFCETRCEKIDENTFMLGYSCKELKSAEKFAEFKCERLTKKVRGEDLNGLPSVYPLPEFDIENATMESVYEFLGNLHPSCTRKLVKRFRGTLAANTELRNKIEQFLNEKQ